MRPRIGLSVMLLESRREAIIELATEGDRLGYDGFFMPEAWAYDMTVLLAEAAARPTRITLGTGILRLWNRSPATAAVAIRIATRRFTPSYRRWWPIPTRRRVRGRRGSYRSLSRRVRSTAIRSYDRAMARPWRRC